VRSEKWSDWRVELPGTVCRQNVLKMRRTAKSDADEMLRGVRVLLDAASRFNGVIVGPRIPSPEELTEDAT
jgi:hypothetical protein